MFFHHMGRFTQVAALGAAVLGISGTPVLTATEDVAYDGFTATAFGGVTPYVYSLVGTWPAGITINSSTGAVSGTPTESGTFASLSVRVTDAALATADLSTFTIEVELLPEEHWNSVVLLASFDTGTTTTPDDSNSAHTLTLTKTGLGVCFIDDEQSVFGGNSAKIWSESGYAGIVVADHEDFNPSGNYTWEGRFRFDVEVGTVQTLFGKWNGASGQNSYIIHYRPGDSLLRFTYSTDGTNAITTADVAFNAVADTWYAIACTKVGSDILWHVNGTYLGKDALAGAVADTSANLVIGNFGSSTSTDLHGWADEIRLTKGVARYGETNYTVDVAAFPRP